MNLGFMHEVDRQKMAKTWLTALIGAFGLVALPCAAFARRT